MFGIFAGFVEDVSAGGAAFGFFHTGIVVDVGGALPPGEALLSLMTSIGFLFFGVQADDHPQEGLDDKFVESDSADAEQAFVMPASANSLAKRESYNRDACVKKPCNTMFAR